MRPTVKAGLALASIAVVSLSVAVPGAAAALRDRILVPQELVPIEPVVNRSLAPQKPRKPAKPKAFFPIAGKPDYGTTENRFGNNRGDHIHEGQDVFAPAGTKLVAVRDGVVIETGYDDRGNYAYIYSPEADETYAYFHMQSAPAVKQGEKVNAGDHVGELGCTGSCWGDHLHFEVHEGKDAYEHAIDPLPLLKKLD